METKPIGEERHLIEHHTSTHHRSLMGFGGEGMETKERREGSL
jgi:hypothetical protein